jgi:hypothetical protein
VGIAPSEHGAVIDKLTGEPVNAELNMIHVNNYPISLLDDNGQEQFLEETLDTTIQTDNGTFKWYVLPSKQPEIDSAPYRINISSPNMYTKQVELDALSFNKSYNLDVELQPCAKILTPANNKESFNAESTIPFKFVTLNQDGNAVAMNNVTVKIVYNGEEIVSYYS